MQLLASALLFGAASAVIPPQQHVLNGGLKHTAKPWSNPLRHISESLESVSADVRALWDEVAMLFPEAVEKVLDVPSPKPHQRRPDDHWHFITKGADVQSVWIENAKGEKERELDGKLESYNLRSRTVDPSKLGIDPGVKQYSGYLDDEENDKHLFYCTSAQAETPTSV